MKSASTLEKWYERIISLTEALELSTAKHYTQLWNSAREDEVTGLIYKNVLDPAWEKIKSQETFPHRSKYRAYFKTDFESPGLVKTNFRFSLYDLLAYLSIGLPGPRLGFSFEDRFNELAQYYSEQFPNLTGAQHQDVETIANGVTILNSDFRQVAHPLLIREVAHFSLKDGLVDVVGGRQGVKIGTLISKFIREGVYPPEHIPHLQKALKEYNDARSNIAGLKPKPYLIVISRHPVDVAGMSSDRGWRSCMTLGSKKQEAGSNSHYVKCDVEAGTLIAYLIKEDDLNINAPIGRVLIKPWYKESKDGVYYVPEEKTYGTVPRGFLTYVEKIMHTAQPYDELPVGVYTIEDSLYKDGGDNYTLTKKAQATPELIQDLKDGKIEVLSDIDFKDEDFSGIDFRGIKISDCSFKDVNLEGCNFAGTTITRTSFENTNLIRCNSVNTTFKDVNFNGANLEGAILYQADLEGANLREVNLSGTNLQGANLEGANLREVNLSGANLRGTDLQSADLFEANLQRANLEGAKLQNANLQKAYLQEAKLMHASLQGGILLEAILYKANLYGANLYGAKLQNSDFEEADLQEVDFRSADLEFANLRSAKLQGANFKDADLRNVNLQGIDLHGVNFVRVNLEAGDLRGVNLMGANFQGANLQGANLRGAGLQRANLEGTNLERANLEGTNLERANLYGANLDGVSLIGANLYRAFLHTAKLTNTVLRGANLTRTFFYKVDLEDTNLEGTDLSGVRDLETCKNLYTVKYDRSTIWPEGFDIEEF